LFISDHHHSFRRNSGSYLPGFDCHGLPLELKAIQALRPVCPDAKTLDPVLVREAARETAMEGIKLQINQFQRLAILTDWEKPWRTLGRLNITAS